MTAMNKHSRMVRIGLWGIALIGGVWLLTQLGACNTMNGFGEDISSMGNALSNAASSDEE
jgi:predicted small secreted protein